MRERSKTSLFLMELILMTLFFSLSAAVCMRVFAYAGQTSEYSGNLSEASLLAQSAAECYKSAGGDLDGAAETLLSALGLEAGAPCLAFSDDGETACAAIGGTPVPSRENRRFILYFDADWRPLASAEAETAFALVLEDTGGSALIRVGKAVDSESSANGEPIFSLEVKAVTYGE